MNILGSPEITVSVAEFITVRFQPSLSTLTRVRSWVSVAEFITVRFQPWNSTKITNGVSLVSVAEFITVRFQPYGRGARQNGPWVSVAEFITVRFQPWAKSNSTTLSICFSSWVYYCKISTSFDNLYVLKWSSCFSSWVYYCKISTCHAVLSASMIASFQ